MARHIAKTDQRPNIVEVREAVFSYCQPIESVPTR